jgi:hypothetical protein
MIGPLDTFSRQAIPAVHELSAPTQLQQMSGGSTGRLLTTYNDCVKTDQPRRRATPHAQPTNDYVDIG